MPVVQWSDFLRSWSFRDCAEVRPLSAELHSDLVTVRRAAAPTPIKCWSGPLTDRAQLQVRQIQALDFPFTLRVELGTALGDVSEPWPRLVGGRVFNDARDASQWSAFGSTAGVLTRRWTLAASLDPLSAVAEIQCVFSLLVDVGTSPAAVSTTLATGVIP